MIDEKKISFNAADDMCGLTFNKAYLEWYWIALIVIALLGVLACICECCAKEENKPSTIFISPAAPKTNQYVWIIGLVSYIYLNSLIFCI